MTEKKICGICGDEKYKATNQWRCARCARRYRKKYREKLGDKYKERQRNYRKAYRHNLKQRLFDMYGKRCTCCGENEEVFLVFDHIQGGGGKHRRSHGHNPQYVMRSMLKENDPTKYQILCHNCNWAKYKLGTCPHAQSGE